MSVIMNILDFETGLEFDAASISRRFNDDEVEKFKANERLSAGWNFVKERNLSEILCVYEREVVMGVKLLVASDLDQLCALVAHKKGDSMLRLCLRSVSIRSIDIQEALMLHIASVKYAKPDIFKDPRFVTKRDQYSARDQALHTPNPQTLTHRVLWDGSELTLCIQNSEMNILQIRDGTAVLDEFRGLHASNFNTRVQEKILLLNDLAATRNAAHSAIAAIKFI